MRFFSNNNSFYVISYYADYIYCVKRELSAKLFL